MGITHSCNLKRVKHAVTSAIKTALLNIQLVTVKVKYPKQHLNNLNTPHHILRFLMSRLQFN